MIYKDDIPVLETGIPVDRLCFSGGRTSVDIARHGGISAIRYFGSQRMNAGLLLFKADMVSAWQQLFRPFVKINEELYYAEFNDTKVFPYGYESICTLGKVSVKHSLTLLNDAMIFDFKVLGSPSDCELEFSVSTCEVCVKADLPVRTWNTFEYDEKQNSMIACAVDDYEEQLGEEEEYLTQTRALKDDYVVLNHMETYIGVTSAFPIKAKKYRQPFEKSIVAVKPEDGFANLVVLFGKDKDEFQKRLLHIQKNARTERAEKVEEYQNIYDTQTKVVCENKTIQSYMNNVRGMIYSLTVEDIPGGMRAADSGYWIWGWDSMVHSDAAMLSGNSQWVKQMLLFHKETAHPKVGIFHSIDLTGQPTMTMAYAAQTLYCIMLYNYYIYSMEIDVLEEYYDFAKQVLENAIASEVGDTGLMKGVALYPDFPEFLDQNGDDISSFNNSICYQAVCCMEKLADKLDRRDDYLRYHVYSLKMRDSFKKYLFDEDKGYYYDSVSSVDFSSRRHYPVYAILWLSTFAQELVSGREQRIADFMHENLTARIGCKILPNWDSSFIADGNQLAIYMPVTEGFYRQMMRIGGYDETMLDVVEHFWSQITIPEALTVEMINHGLTPDSPGRKQAFCINSWYVLFFSYYLGMSMSIDGLVFNKPMCVNSKVRVEGLKWGEKIIDLVIDLSKNLDINIIINGRSFERKYITYSDLKEQNLIRIEN